MRREASQIATVPRIFHCRHDNPRFPVVRKNHVFICNNDTYAACDSHGVRLRANQRTITACSFDSGLYRNRHHAIGDVQRRPGQRKSVMRQRAIMAALIMAIVGATGMTPPALARGGGSGGGHGGSGGHGGFAGGHAHTGFVGVHRGTVFIARVPNASMASRVVITRTANGVVVTRTRPVFVPARPLVIPVSPITAQAAIIPPFTAPVIPPFAASPAVVPPFGTTAWGRGRLPVVTTPIFGSGTVIGSADGQDVLIGRAELPVGGGGIVRAP